MNPTQALALASELTSREIDLMAHALGWPDTLNVHRPRCRVRWGNPYRNYFAAGADDAKAWDTLVSIGLATIHRDAPGQCPVYSVTDAGKAVTRARLLVHRLLVAP